MGRPRRFREAFLGVYQKEAPSFPFKIHRQPAEKDHCIREICGLGNPGSPRASVVLCVCLLDFFVVVVCLSIIGTKKYFPDHLGLLGDPGFS